MGAVRRTLFLLALALGPALAHAAGALDQLHAFVGRVQSAEGRFSQSTVAAQGPGRPAQTGSFVFQRPGRFKWAVEQPYEQLVVSDGKDVFQYDPDLAQVTVRKVDQAIGASPAAILFGSGSLEQAFDLSELPAREGLAWLRAKPRSADAGFAQVDIGFKDDLPARIELLDTFGQVTRVELSGIRPNPQLPADAFRFEPPAGVDMVRM